MFKLLALSWSFTEFCSALSRLFHKSVIDEQLVTTSEARLDELMASPKQFGILFDWGFMGATTEQKKEIITRVLHEFVLYPDRGELRYKLPVTEAHVAELLHVG